MGIKLGKETLSKLNIAELELLRDWWRPREGDTVTDLISEFGYFSGNDYMILDANRNESLQGKFYAVYDNELNKLYPCPDLIMLTEFFKSKLNMNNVCIEFENGICVKIIHLDRNYEITSAKISDALHQMLDVVIEEAYLQGYLIKEKKLTEKMDMFELE